TAHVVFRVAYELPDRSTVPMPPEPQIATALLVDGGWKLVLDEWSQVGMPGLRNMMWTSEQAAPGSHVTG
ncbi:MAG: hypothetical protein ACREMU_05535, partial [Gemmatimonadaceae bacterium]